MDKIKEKIRGAYLSVCSFFHGIDWWRVVFSIVIALLYFVLGWVACKHFNANVIEVPAEPQVVTEVKEVKIPVSSDTQTQVQYVEKESADDADVEIHADAPSIVVDYNGEKTAFDAVSSETQKFDKGKLQVNQQSKVTLDVTPIVTREVQTAVEKNTKELTEQKNKELAQAHKDEAKKRHKRTIEAFVAGAALGAVAGLAH